MFTSRALAATAAVLCATAAGCGPSSAVARDPGPRPEIRRVHRAWLERLAAGDAAACRLLTREARAAMVNANTGACFYDVGRFAAGLSDEERAAFSHVRVRRVSVRGGRARIDDRDLVVPPALADVVSDNGRPMVLKRVDGRWRIDRIG